MILPAGKVISYPALKKLQMFYQQGGKVIATHLLPSKSAEFGMDTGVQTIIKQMFNVDGGQMPATATTNKNANGGAAMFLPMADSASLAQALNVIAPAPDVILENTSATNSETGKLSYLHKIKEGKDIYYIANSTTNPINTFISLKGKMKTEMWDPNTGNRSVIKNAEHVKVKGVSYTRLKLGLEPVKSIFIIGDNVIAK